MIDFNHILVAMEYGLKGLPTTLYMSFTSIVIGIVIGIIIAMIRIFEVPFLSKILKYAVILIRGIPILLIILIIYFYGSNLMHYLNNHYQFNIDTSKINTELMCIIALSIVGSTRASEIFRGAFYSIDYGQIDAAKSLGYSKIQAFVDIYLGQLLVIALPMLSNLAIGLVKATSLASIIAVVEVLQSSLIPATINFNFLESYIGAGIILWGLAILIELFFNRLYIVYKKY